MITATAQTPEPGRYKRGRNLGRSGYTVAECLYCPGLFFVHKPNGTRYTVDAVRRTCNCPARLPDCAHLVFLDVCIAHAAWLERRRMGKEAYPPQPTRKAAKQPNRIGKRRAAILARQAAVPVPAPTIEKPLPRLRMDVREDFGDYSQ